MSDDFALNMALDNNATLVRHIEAQAAEIERLQLECKAQYDRGYYDGRRYDGAEERAKIVAWLRSKDTYDFDDLAIDIEAGEHLK